MYLRMTVFQQPIITVNLNLLNPCQCELELHWFCFPSSVDVCAWRWFLICSATWGCQQWPIKKHLSRLELCRVCQWPLPLFKCHSPLTPPPLSTPQSRFRAQSFPDVQTLLAAAGCQSQPFVSPSSLLLLLVLFLCAFPSCPDSSVPPWPDGAARGGHQMPGVVSGERVQGFFSRRRGPTEVDLLLLVPQPWSLSPR